MRPVFELPGVSRYRVMMIIEGRYYWVVYDTRLRCLVTMLRTQRNISSKVYLSIGVRP